MQTRMSMVIEKGDADPTRARRRVEHARRDGNPLLIPWLLVSCFLSGSSPFTPGKVHRDDGRGEGEGREDAAGYEERLQVEGADVGDEGDGVDLAGVPGAAFC